MAIDWDITLGFVDGQQELLLELIDLFFAEHAELMPRIEQAINAADTDDLQLFAHRFKGCLRYFGESKAGTLAWQLETLGKSGTVDDADKLLAELHLAVDEMLPELNTYKQEHQQP